MLIDLSQSTAEILHWGKALGKVTSIASYTKAAMEPVAHAELDDPMYQSIWRENSRGNTGLPALLGHSAGKRFSQKFEIVSVAQTETSATITGRDAHAELEIENVYRFLGSGVLSVSQTIRNLGAEAFTLNELNVFMPLPDQVAESMDFTGRWVNERQLQRRAIQPGQFVREEREGRSSHDYTIMQYAMTRGAGYQTGEVWGLGIMFSGNSKHIIERQQSGRTFIAAGEMAFITGHSGAGKSTLLRLVHLSERPSRGTVLVNERNLAKVRGGKVPLHRRQVGVVFQDHRLLTDRSVFDNVALPLLIAGTPGAEVGKRVRAVLDKVGLGDRERSLPLQLSTGEQQRVGIARAIVAQPQLLVADEPTGNLDPQLAAEIMQLFASLPSLGTTVIVASHDLALVKRMRRRVLVLDHGRLVDDISPEDLADE